MTIRDSIHSQFDARVQGEYPRNAMQEHLEMLRDTVVKMNAQQVIEIGVCSGQSTIAFLAGLLETGGQLWSCDRDEPEEPIVDLIDKVPFWTFVQADMKDALSEAPENCDILLCDASHESRDVEWQLKHYGNRVREHGGMIFVHDLDWQPVKDALETWHYVEYQQGHGMAVIVR